jgi:hypothetical protein
VLCCAVLCCAVPRAQPSQAERVEAECRAVTTTKQTRDGETTAKTKTTIQLRGPRALPASFVPLAVGDERSTKHQAPSVRAGRRTPDRKASRRLLATERAAIRAAPPPPTPTPSKPQSALHSRHSVLVAPSCGTLSLLSSTFVSVTFLSFHLPFPPSPAFPQPSRPFPHAVCFATR